MSDLSPVLFLIIATNGIVSYKGFTDQAFFHRYMFEINQVLRNKDYKRIITSAFLHVDSMHLFFNMFTLYFFGPIVIRILGVFYFLMIYFGSILVSGLATSIFHRNETFYSAVGASGAISGVLFSSILLFPQMKLMFFFIPIGIPGYLFGMGYLAYTIYGMKSRMGNIGHAAHLGGAIGGIAITLISHPNLFFLRWQILILLFLPIVFLLILQLRK